MKAVRIVRSKEPLEIQEPFFFMVPIIKGPPCFNCMAIWT